MEQAGNIPHELTDLQPFQARSIIEEMRKGSVPADYVQLFTVGRDNWLTFIEDDLVNYIAEGGAKVRFLHGNYGDGKTHFMSVIRHIALKQGFAVSLVVLTRDVPIHKFEAVYQSIVQQLCGNFAGIGIRSLLNSWLDSLATKEFTTEESTTATTKEKSLSREQITELSETLRHLPDMNVNFANALIALVKNRFLHIDEGIHEGESDAEQQEERINNRETLFHWFEAGKITKRELKPFSIFEKVDKTNSKQMLNSLNSFLRFCGHKGIVLLLDELETVMAMAASVRNAAYENVRLLIDNSEQASCFHIFFAIIPDVLLTEKGFKSYDALWSRVRSIAVTGQQNQRMNYRGVLIDLHRTPLQEDELLRLGESLRQIHQISYRWDAVDAVPDQLLKDICANQKKMGLLSEVRLFVKQVIRLLDMAEQGEDVQEKVDLAEHIVSSQQEVEQDKVEQLQPSWDS